MAATTGRNDVPGIWGSRDDVLEDEHGVTKGEESILLLDGHLVRFHDEVVAGEGGHEHQERALGHMEVRQETLGDGELVWRIDKLVRPTGIALQRVRCRETRLDRAHDRRSDGRNRVGWRLEGFICS